MRVHDTAGIVFALMVREHDISTLLREVFLSVRLGEDKSVELDKTYHVAHDGIAVFGTITVLVPDDVVHAQKIVNFVK